MKPFQKRMVGFLFGCIGVRSLLTLTAKNINNHYLPYIGYFAIIVSISLMYQYISKSRNKSILGGPIWWDHLRPIFATLYAIIAYLAINKSPYTWYIFLIDVLFGLSAFIYINFY